ncbi:hypothetical protein NEDG_01153 [Nematocida displodere]|uniref:Amino acid transporter transmembrane domain-containing protein n=1 Tax=Nematocida displodere TaxID=1805483 RepID=A0A177EAP5_9MICR|nr:hypothetical protein NEDG_01153 [Nematocida displodere]
MPITQIENLMEESPPIHDITQDTPSTDAVKPYLRGLNLYYAAISAILGAGVLFMHVGIADGGICAWIMAVLLCGISGTVVSARTYRMAIDMLRATGKEEGYQLLPVTANFLRIPTDETDPERQHVKKYATTQVEAAPHNASPNPPRPSLTFGSLVLDEHKAVRICLNLAIVSLSAGSLIVYLGLMYQWVWDIVDVLRAHTPFGVFPSLTKWGSFGGLVLVCMYLAYLPTPGDNKIITTISAISLMLLTIMVLAMLLIVRYSSSFAITKCITFSSEAWKGMVVGRHFSFLKFTGAVATIFFAINSQQNMPVYFSLAKPKSKKAFFKIFSIAMMVASSLFLVVGVCGYFITFASSSNYNLKLDNILTNIGTILEHVRPLLTSALFKTFLLLTTGIKVLMIPVLLSAFMWQCAAAKNVLINVFSGYFKNYKAKSIFRKAIGPALAALALIPVFLNVDLGFIIRVLGSGSGAYIILFIPAWIVLRGTHSKDGESTWLHYMGAAFMGLGFLVLIAYTVIDSTPLRRIFETPLPATPKQLPICFPDFD